MLVGDLGLKAAAVALTGVLWSISVFLTGSSVRSVTAPVEFSNVAPDFEIAQLSAHTVQVQLRGSAWILDSVSLTTVVVRFDLSGAKEGPLTLNVHQSTLNLPPGLVIEGVSPPTISVRLVRRSQPPTRP